MQGPNGCERIWSPSGSGFVLCVKPKGHEGEHEGSDFLGRRHTYRDPTPEEKAERDRQYKAYHAEQNRIIAELHQISSAERIDPAICAKAAALIPKLDDREDRESCTEEFLRSVLEHIAAGTADDPVACAKAATLEEP